MPEHSLFILTQYFPPEMGAPQSRLFETAIALKNRGWKITVITSMPNYPTGKIFKTYRNRFSCTEEFDGLTIRRYWLFASNSAGALPRIFSMLSFSITCLFSVFYLLRKKPAFVFTESPPLILGLSGWILARICQAKFVFNVSDIWPLTAKELGAISDGWLYRILERLEVFIYNRSDLITGQSQEIVDHIKGLTSNPVQLFRNGVAASRFKVSPERPRSGKLKFIYAGLLGVAQGIATMCREINFRDFGVEFHIYGAGTEEDQIRSFLQQHPERGIFFHGKVDRETIDRILPEHDVAFIPLVKHLPGAVPSKIYEAMAAGLPILFSGGGEGARIIQEHDLGWTCTPLQIDEIKQTISLITGANGALTVKRKNCIKAAQHLFSRESQVANLDAILKATIS